MPIVPIRPKRRRRTRAQTHWPWPEYRARRTAYRGPGFGGALPGCLVLAVLLPTLLFGEPPEAWPEIEQALRRRSTYDTEWDRRPMWKYLAEYLATQLDRTPDEAARRDVLRWARYTALHGSPILLPEARSLAATRRIGSISWRAVSPDPYRLCLLAVPGRILLFGYPDPEIVEPRTLIEVQQSRLTATQEKPYMVRRAHEEIHAEMHRMGNRWPFLLVPIFPEEPGDSSEVPRAELVDGRVVVEWNGRREPLRLPDEATLSECIGSAFDESEIPPPGNRPLYLAIDWSQFLAGPKLRAWLAAELQAALESAPEHWLVRETVYFHNGREAAPWPIAKVRAGRWPDPLPRPHSRDTLGALASAVRAAAACSDARLVFLTWNAGLTVDPNREDTVSLHAELVRSVRLRVIQVHGERVEPFERIAGRTNYDVVEYVPVGAERARKGSLLLFDRGS